MRKPDFFSRVDEKKGISILLLHFPGRLESGRVVCAASNGVGGVAVAETSRLVVHHGPEIVKTPSLSKYAIPRGSPAFLRCRAVAVPRAEFAWRMESEALNRSKEVDPVRGKFNFVTFFLSYIMGKLLQDDPSHGESILDVRPVRGHDGVPFNDAADSILKV